MSERDPPRLAHPLLDAARDELPDERQLSALALKLGPLIGPGGGGGGGGGGGASAGAGAGKGAALVKSAAAAKAGIGFSAGKALVAAAAVTALGLGTTAAVIRARSSPTVTTTGLVAATPSSLVATTAADERLMLAPAPAGTTSPSTGGGAANARRTSAPDDPQEEVHLLERAQDALRTSPDEALRLTAEHAHKFPNGALAQEREVIAIDALVRKGDRADAQARADKFAKTWPHSTDLRRVQVLVGAP